MRELLWHVAAKVNFVNGQAMHQEIPRWARAEPVNDGKRLHISTTYGLQYATTRY